MALTDLATNGPARTIKGPPCAVCLLIDGLDDTEAAALRAMLANPHWRYTALSEALEAEGYDVAQGTLARHARGKCAAGEKLR